MTRAVDPRTGTEFGPDFSDASLDEVAAAVDAAVRAFPVLRDADRALLLRRIADELEALGDALLELADHETGLGLPRLTGERGRTCGQLRMFADAVDEGSYVDAIIDHAVADAVPPRPDLRRMQIPLGPVAVFGAGNFPLAFSVPGGDTASALAAGCPVVVKAHPGHPGTSDLCGQAVSRAAASMGLPAGVFTLLHGASHEVGGALVRAAGIKAVGFTGSLAGGRALFDIAAAREEPIPVYAEMGSVNPLFVSPGALAARAQSVAEGFVASLTMGTGQFCTKPGLVVVPAGEDGDVFVSAVAGLVAEGSAGWMLDARLQDTLAGRLEQTLKLDGVVEVARGSADGDGTCHPAVVLTTAASTFLSTPELAEEHFGPVCVIVRTAPHGELLAVAAALPGSLTATIHCEPGEDVSMLVDVLRERAGRILFNGFPTGVAVVAAQHHGGPYPATTAPAHTSVGTTAIRRFLRPVAWQDAPAALLPPELVEENPLGIMRLVDGEFRR